MGLCPKTSQSGCRSQSTVTIARSINPLRGENKYERRIHSPKLQEETRGLMHVLYGLSGIRINISSLTRLMGFNILGVTWSISIIPKVYLGFNTLRTLLTI